MYCSNSNAPGSCYFQNWFLKTVCRTFWTKIHNSVCLVFGTFWYLSKSKLSYAYYSRSVNCLLTEEIDPHHHAPNLGIHLNCIQQMLNASKERQYNHIRITPLVPTNQETDVSYSQLHKDYHSEIVISLASSTRPHPTANETQGWKSGRTGVPTSHISRLTSWIWRDKLSVYTLPLEHYFWRG